MISGLIRWSAHNVVLVLIVTMFIVAAGIYSVAKTPLDAIPDLSDVQVIVFTEYPGQAPQVVEDQVTFPLTTAMLAVPHSKVVRGLSLFGSSFVYIIFEDGTDIDRELYLSALVDRTHGGVSFVASPDGGMDIEKVAHDTPERVHTIPVDFAGDITDAHGKQIAAILAS